MSESTDFVVAIKKLKIPYSGTQYEVEPVESNQEKNRFNIPGFAQNVIIGASIFLSTQIPGSAITQIESYNRYMKNGSFISSSSLFQNIEGNLIAEKKEIMENHRNYLIEESQNFREIKNFGDESLKLLYELAPIFQKYETEYPGLQLSRMPSFILSIGKNNSKSVVMEFKYNPKKSIFNPQIAFLTRLNGSFFLKKIDKKSISYELSNFFVI